MYKINEKIFIKKLQKAGVIKEIEDFKYKVTYFDNEEKRQTEWFEFNDLKKYKKPLEIKVKYLDKDMPKLQKIEIGDLIDLYNVEEISLKTGDFKVIPLGVAIELPKGWKADLVPRSSTFKKWGIIQVNSPGKIDHSYCSNEDQWGMAVYATRDIVIEKYSRICQFEITKQMPKIKLIEVDDLRNEKRGGFGSTGSK